MAKKLFISAFLPVLLFCAGCATENCGKTQKSLPAYTGKKIRTGFYIDQGSRGGGVIHLARLLTYSPQIELVLLKGEDLRKGRLKGLDLMVMPGGSSHLQMKSMGKEGVKALQEFIRKGGAYVGICAGFHITLNRPERAQIFPYTYIREAVGYKANVQIDLSKEGAALLGVRPGKRLVCYSRGPVAREAAWDKGSCKTYARYTSSVGPLGRAGKSFFNTPALIAGNYGRGKVIATSFHPEYLPETYELFVGCIYAVTGVKITPQIPVSRYRPLRTAYYASAAKGGHAQAIRELTALERSQELAVENGLKHELLRVSDLLILPDASEAAGQRFVKVQWIPFLVKFMDRGGRILAAGDAWKVIPDHKNLTRIPAGASLVREAAKIAAE